MTKKLLSVLVILTLVLGLTAAFALESSAASIALIYESATDPVIDGVVDSEGYRLVCETGADPTGNLKTWEGCTVDDTMQLYACWKGDYLYLAVKVVCNGDHVAYKNDAAGGTHYIFNAHHMMTCVCPGDPYQEVYKGGNEDGSWDWSELYNASYVWEWTIINPSQETDSDIADHFRNMSAQEGFEYKVTTADGYDTYEQKIPLSKIVNSLQPNGVKAEVGSLFGFGFQMGLSDWGDGYTDETFEDYVYFSDYFTGAKYINGMAYCKLASDLEKDPSDTPEEPAAPEAIDEQYDIFPQLDGLWVATPHDEATVTVTYSQGTTVIGGSISGKWPSASATLPKTIYIGEGTSLVYDFSFDVGTTSIRVNDQKFLHDLIPDAPIESGSGDLQPGTYSGAITYDQLVELLGADENGLVRIDSFTIYSVNGAEITFNTFKFDPSYVPPVVEPDVSEPETDDSSEPEAVDPSEPADESTPTTNDSSAPTTSDDASEEKGGNTGLIIGIAIAVVVVIAIVVVVVVVSKKKKA